MGIICEDCRRVFGKFGSKSGEGGLRYNDLVYVAESRILVLIEFIFYELCVILVIVVFVCVLTFLFVNGDDDSSICLVGLSSGLSEIIYENYLEY